MITILGLQGKKGLEQHETFGEETAISSERLILYPDLFTVEEAEGEIWSSNKILLFLIG